MVGPWRRLGAGFVTPLHAVVAVSRRGGRFASCDGAAWPSRATHSRPRLCPRNARAPPSGPIGFRVEVDLELQPPYGQCTVHAVF